MNTTDKEWILKLESEGDDSYIIDHTLSNIGLRKYRELKLQQIADANQTIEKIDAKLASRSDEQEAADSKVFWEQHSLGVGQFIEVPPQSSLHVNYGFYPLYFETSMSDEDIAIIDELVEKYGQYPDSKDCIEL